MKTEPLENIFAEMVKRLDSKEEIQKLTKAIEDLTEVLGKMPSIGEYPIYPTYPPPDPYPYQPWITWYASSSNISRNDGGYQSYNCSDNVS